jgi:hypothetical protein
LWRDDELHDLCRPVSDLQSEHVTQALLVRHLRRVGAVAIDQQAVLHYLEGEFGSPPFAHRGLGRVRESLILEPQGVQAHQAAGVDVRLGLGQRAKPGPVQ